MSDYILAIDQGTTGSTVLLLDKDLNLVSRGYREFRQIYPKPGWVEHDPGDIWNSVTGAIADALKEWGMENPPIKAIGITNQRETSIIWDRKSGRPMHNAIVWQCRRTADICQKLKDAGHEDLFRQKTGLVLDPYFSGTKYKWILDQVTGLRESAMAGKIAAGTVDSYLVYRLTGSQSHVTDVSNASRTLLMDIHKGDWDPELCSILDVPQSILPKIVGSAEVYGYTKGVPGLADGIPVSGMAGDQQAALFGQACFTPGEAKCTYGTGAFMLMNTGDKPAIGSGGLLGTIAWNLDGTMQYASEGSAFIAGAAVQWLRDSLGFIESAPQVEALAASVPDSEGVIVVPAFVGLGAPHWRPEARGIMTGLTRGTTRAHIARATLEGIALQNVDILKLMEKESGRDIKALKVDGGACANNLLMQMQADFLGCTIVRPKLVETTALGAAFLAGLGAGLFSGVDDIRASWQEDRVFEPKMKDAEREEILARWREAVSKA
ncbi:glycerol kinase [Desulfatibacillum alkenivorans DSM 16219]|jgi:glycerol kinase|uniref:Glycerol kinase n=1 Tax=Desulfatibacillum alkenivorans DSM 16219 TaxID=1121393 RepID=A0A1M6L9N6_9BACT|nr:glycerol kinase GlpK [Desulfatibacillum alkenivorans]SHJ67907.1 glycerol kinase [Desulfatibacillum alkenivorans DSM 16219]